MEKKHSWKRWLWWFSLAAAVILFYKIAGNLKSLGTALGTAVGIVSPFVLGFVLAFFLYGPSHRLELWLSHRKNRLVQKCARAVSLIIVYIALLGVIALVVYLVAPRLVDSLTDLIRQIPGYVSVAKEKLEAMSQPGGLLEKLELSDKLEEIYQGVLKAGKKLVNAENVTTALKGVMSFTSTVVNTVIGIIVSVYMLAGRERLVNNAKAVLGLWMKPRHLDTAENYYHRIAGIFYRYFYGSLLDALMVGVIASIGLFIFRVPYALLLGIGIGLLNMIPYFGSLIGVIIIVIITLLSRNIYAALGVLVYLVVMQQVDANILEPRIVGDSVGLQPIYVLLGITLFGGLFGFWGIFLGVPLMAIVQMVVKDAIKRRKEPKKE